MPVIAIILGVIMVLGGVLPNAANGIIQSQLHKMLNQPEQLNVNIYPNAPSFGMIGASLAHAEIEAKRFVFSDVPVERLYVRAHGIDVDTSGEQMRLRKPTQVLVQVRLTEDGLNRFLASDTLKEALANIKKNSDLAGMLDADISDLTMDLQTDKALLSGKAKTMGGFFTVPFELSGRFRLKSESELFTYDVDAATLNRPVSADVLRSILDQINPILDLTRFNNEDMTLYLKEVSVHDGYIDLGIEADIKQIPKASD
jgi:hypothetical protein